jgi:phosphatidate cytidylyltransferase
VSPKKTRAGFVGALVGASVGAVLASLWYLPALPLAHALPLGLFAGALGQMGDLVESLLKRSTGIKDSGGIVPGHGGMLDRIDALIVVSPIVYLYGVLTGLIP